MVFGAILLGVGLAYCFVIIIKGGLQFGILSILLLFPGLGIAAAGYNLLSKGSESEKKNEEKDAKDQQIDALLKQNQELMQMLKDKEAKKEEE